MMKFPKLTVGPDTTRMLGLGHPWVIADRYTRSWPKGIKSGDLAGLESEDGRFLGTAMIDPQDRVVARLIDREEVRINSDWLGQRLQVAIDLRSCHLDLDETDAYRIVNAEGDALPGLVVDRYGDYLLVQTYSECWLPHLPTVVGCLKQQFNPKGVWHKPRPRQTRNLKTSREDRDYGKLLLGHSPPQPMQVAERDLRFWVDLKSGLHTGLFLDQRENRDLFRRHCAGKKVLNLFSYTGAFSVTAAVGGAGQVVSVDASTRYMEWSRENFSLNRINPKRHRFEVGDCLAVMEQLAVEKEKFDVVFIDPPSFSSTKKGKFSTRKGTSAIIAASLGLLRPGGLLFASSNHQKTSAADYLKELRRGALQAGTELRIIHQTSQGADFPFPVTFPEGSYLKFMVGVRGA
ncbi:MAG: class I SAM-dependent rRNA methyltransferase [Desulfuromonas sp.]|nr:MAG: class I SAM-dependent rRNA methyltransferase [Desulfuromonas sp.]